MRVESEDMGRDMIMLKICFFIIREKIDQNLYQGQDLFSNQLSEIIFALSERRSFWAQEKKN